MELLDDSADGEMYRQRVKTSYVTLRPLMRFIMIYNLLDLEMYLIDRRCISHTEDFEGVTELLATNTYRGDWRRPKHMILH